jgi:selenocysteine lyase/cysteine desulfurase
MQRREFLGCLSRAGLAAGVGASVFAAARDARAALAPSRDVAPEALATDEQHWRRVATLWAPAPDFTNLEYGYFHAAALPVLEAELRMARSINTRNSHYKRIQASADREAARTALAAVAGVAPEEIAITRNATESLDTLILGLDLEPGDEIVHGDQDYGSMVEALEQKARRHGVVLRKVAVPVHPRDDDEVVEAYASAFTSRTRLLLVTHLINLTGHIVPVRRICERAHAVGAEVIVDSAHGFGLVDFKLSDLGCDYLGSSLHKWMCSPLGLGLLYVRRDKIAKVWPLIADTGQDTGNIRKLEQLGTRPESAHVGLLEAIRLHEELGPAAKEARMRHLQLRWRAALSSVPGVIVNTPAEPRRHAAVGNVGLDGVEPRALADYLWREHAIFTAPINHPRAKGVRVTPGLPTLAEHVDRFVEAMQAARRHFA